MKPLPALTLSCCLMAGVSVAQSPGYELDPAVRIGNSIQSTVKGAPSQPFLVLWDLETGPLGVFGETLWVGLGPSFFLGRSGLLDSKGRDGSKIQVPQSKALVGLILFGQAVLFDKKAPNGVFRLSNGESTIVHNEAALLVSAFDDPKKAGFTGSFESGTKGRLLAGPLTRRLVRPMVSAGGTKFNSPIAGPLHKSGTRIQMVFRSKDLGGTGEPEALTAVHWRPFGGKVQVDSYARWVIDVGHSSKVPDYRVSQSTRLPLFPQSGLENTFLRNEKKNEAQIRWVDSTYSILPGALRKDGYIAYPRPRQEFVWNGTESLLLDFKVPFSSGTKGLNGQQIYLMVQSSPKPGSRAYRFGSNASKVDPFKTTIAYNSDNALHDHQFEFTKIQSSALSPWLDSGKTAPNYFKPMMAASFPAGTSLLLEYQGARDKKGAGATSFSNDIDKADGKPWIRYRVTFRSNALHQRRPSIDTLVIPVR